jgi:hypothetical protein
VKSSLTDDFLVCFRELPDHVQDAARRNYRRWRLNPNHPSLHFRQIHPIEPLYSVRIGIGWRALGLVEGDEITWFWIGSHAEYDRLIQRY